MTAVSSLPRLQRLSRFAAVVGRRDRRTRRRRFVLGSLSVSGLLGALLFTKLGSVELGVDAVIGATSYAFWLVGGLATFHHLRGPTSLAVRLAELRGLSAKGAGPRALDLARKLFVGFAVVALPGLGLLVFEDTRVLESAARLLGAASVLALGLALLAFLIEASRLRYPRVALALGILLPLAVDPFGERFPHLVPLTARLLEEARPPLGGLE